MSALRSLFAGAAFAAGILLADLAQPAGPAAIAAAIAAGGAAALLMAAAAFLHLQNPASAPGSLLPALKRPTVALAALGLASAGFCSLGIRLAALEEAHLPRLAGETAEVTGRVATDPRGDDRSSRFFLAVRKAGSRRIHEKLAVTAYGKLAPVQVGDTVLVRAKIKSLDKRDRFDASLVRKSVTAKASASASDVRLLSRTDNPALKAANHFRARISSAARGGAGAGRSALVLGLVMGDQRSIPRQVVDDFRAAGLSHLTAVSGQNVAMVMAPLFAVMAWLKVSRRVQLVAGLVSLGLFALVTRWEPSVLRATLMAAVALSAWLFGRRPDAVHLMGVVFFLLLAVDPMLLWSIGFQLSFAATAGILLLGPHVAKRLARPFVEGNENLADPADGSGSDDAPGPLPSVGPSGALSSRPSRGAASLAASAARGPASKWLRFLQVASIGISAQVAVLPFIAWHFGRLSVVSLPANLLALPFVPPVTVLGLVGGVVALVSMDLAKPLMWLAGLFAWALQEVARLFGGSAHAQVDVGPWSPLQTIAAVLAAAAALCWLLGRGRAARWPAVLAVLAAVGASVLPAAGSELPSGMRLTFFDVGQGDAALIETGSGARMVVDGGPDPDDLADRLKRRGISRLDLVVASHGHADHVEGLAKVLSRFNVRLAVDPGVPTEVLTRVEQAGGKRGNAFQAVKDEEGLKIGDMEVDFLGPPPDAADHVSYGSKGDQGPEGSAVNDASVVARVSYGGQCALFTGDLEEEGQQRILSEHPRLIDCTIVKAPHHGSARLLAEFVEAADPEWVPISVGENDYGHPSAKALHLFQRAGARVLRTDQQGDIVLLVDRTGRVTVGR